MELHNYENCPFSYKDGQYGGAAGDKSGIIVDGENWLVKYPKSTRSMRDVEISYTTSPLCEYLGSHVYGILGYNVHETNLGIRNGKVVVACKDFTDNNTDLLEIRTIKNRANEALSEKFGMNLSSSGSSNVVNFPELMLHIRNNDILKAISGIERHFFEQAIVDIFINNNDRNNGNWGILRPRDKEPGTADRIAPVYDNGGSFQNKLSDAKAKGLLERPELIEQQAYGSRTIYADENGKIYSVKKFLQLHSEYPEMEKSIRHVVPLIKEKMSDIKALIQDIPNTVELEDKKYGLCTESIRNLYLLQLDTRLEKVLEPVYDQILEKENQKESAPLSFAERCRMAYRECQKNEKKQEKNLDDLQL